jgi:hypothetical protein
VPQPRVIHVYRIDSWSGRDDVIHLKWITRHANPAGGSWNWMTSSFSVSLICVAWVFLGTSSVVNNG